MYSRLHLCTSLCLFSTEYGVYVGHSFSRIFKNVLLAFGDTFGAELRSGAGFLKSVAPRKSKIFKNHLSRSDMSRAGGVLQV